MNTIEQVAAVLNMLKPERAGAGHRQDWLRVGFALHWYSEQIGVDKDAVYKLWVEFSKKGGVGYDEEGTSLMWAKARADRPGAITLATLWQMAKDDGGVPASYEPPGTGVSEDGAVDYTNTLPPQTRESLIHVMELQIPAKYVEHYDYRYKNGKIAFTTVRYLKANGEKTFVFMRPDKGENWVMGEPDAKRPLYNLEKLLVTPTNIPILVVEGERKADYLDKLGYVCVASAGGANNPHRTDWKPCEGRSLFIWRDNDNPGIDYAKAVANIGTALKAKIRILRPPVINVGDDVIDFGKVRDDIPDIVRRDVDQLIESAKYGSKGAVVTMCEDTQIKETEWLWKNYLPVGHIVGIFGPQGSGKSTLIRDIAARLSSGRDMPDHSISPSGVVGTLYHTCEDSWSDTIAPQLEKMGYGKGLIHYWSKIVDTETGEESSFTFDDLGVLRRYLNTYPDIRLVVFDPIGGFMGDIRANSDSEVRSKMLNGLKQIAEEYNICVVLMGHHRKADSTNVDNMALGSIALTAFPRVIYHVKKVNHNGERYVSFSCGKRNLRGESPPWFKITLDSGDFDKLVWSIGGSENSQELADEERLDDKTPPMKASDVEEMLRRMLASGSKSTTDIYKECTSLGVGRQQIYRASSRIGVIREGITGTLTWRLP